MPVIDIHGTDITELTRVTAANAGIPHVLLVGCMYGEAKGFDPRSERWGTQTAKAKAAIARSDWGELQQIIDAVGSDISFGRCHRIVRYHWAGNQQYTVKNCLAVRQAVWDDPERDVREMASWLASFLKRAQKQDLRLVQGDTHLAACLIYNRGHEVVTATEFASITTRVNNYREGLALAPTLITQASMEEDMGKLEEKSDAGKLMGGARWPADNPLPVVELQDPNGNGLRIMPLTDGLALEFDNGDIWEPVDANPTSLSNALVRLLEKNPEPVKQALAAQGFQIAPLG